MRELRREYIMSAKKHTDVPPGWVVEPIVVVQPYTTTDLEKDDLVIEDDEYFDHILQDTLGFKGLVHRGILQCTTRHHNSFVEPSCFIPCGGILAIELLKDKRFDRENYHWLGSEVVITCSGCGLVAGSTSLNLEGLCNVLFHLMLKQMVPGTPSCNYLDCSNEIVLAQIASSDLKKANTIKSLGVLAIDVNTFCGITRATTYRSIFSLGFGLGPILRTVTHGCDGLDRWLQFLCKEQVARCKDTIMNKLLPYVAGPKRYKGK